ncbi:MAG: hypothetical protein B7Z20_10765, partial [Sphingobium sp. 32-64-5]
MRIFFPAAFDANRRRGLTGPRRVAAAGRAVRQGFGSLRHSAQQGFTFAKRSAQQGFTLVELMVVIAIIGFASAAVMLAIPDPRG